MVIKIKMPDNVKSALNEQINKELYSSYLYLSMAAYAESINLKGFAIWLKAQASEEVEHAMKIFNFIVERGGRVILKAIDTPPMEWTSPLTLFEHVYEHETKVTEMIYNLVKLAKEENDYATEVFLQWFVEEQVEEESSADEIVQQLKLVGAKGQALLMIDKALGVRGQK